MKKLLETMYILTPDSYAFLRNDNICISVGGTERASVPAAQVDSIVFVGKNTVSTALLAFCGSRDITLTFLGARGEFCGRVCGPVSGNVLLRKRQYDSLNDPDFVSVTVRNILFGKIRNSKDVLMRYARTSSNPEHTEAIYQGAAKLSGMRADPVLPGLLCRLVAGAAGGDAHAQAHQHGDGKAHRHPHPHPHEHA